MRSRFYGPALVVVGASLVGCSTIPDRNRVIDQARSNYDAAVSSPDITKHAAVELQQAGLALEAAEQAWSQRKDAALVEHLAYLAKQRVAIADNTGKLKTAEIAIANSGAERDKIRLELRTTEADAARAQVEAARDSAARKAAETAASNEVREDEILRKTAETAAETAAAAKQTAEELAAANASLKQMESKLEELNAKKTERGLVITLGDVLFDVNKAELKPGAERNVQKIADFLKEYPERTAQIEGFTDNTGDDGYNQALSERRAEAVRTFLIDRGISGDRASARGYGESKPIASNDTPASRQLNRRVEIVLSEDDSAAVNIAR